MIYLTGPYSGNEQKNFEALTGYAARMMAAGYYVFSPITMCHPMKAFEDLPGDFHFWREYDTKMIRLCRVLVVLKLDGWEASIGVSAEIEIATKQRLPIFYLNYNDNDDFRMVPRS